MPDISSTDWEKSYKEFPHLLTKAGVKLDPSFPQSRPPDQGKPLENWLHQTLASIERIVKQIERFTDRKTGMIPRDAIERNQELKAVTR